MIRGIFIINNHGKARLQKCFDKLVRGGQGRAGAGCGSALGFSPCSLPTGCH